MTSVGAVEEAWVPSHVLPDGSMSLGGMKEELSVAYLHMLASATGLTIGQWSQDYDVRDVTLKSSVEYPDLGDAGIDVQLKCTGQESVDRADTIAWSVTARTLTKLRKTNRATPYLLCVLLTQPKPDVWLHPNTGGLLARSHMYYEWGHKLPALVSGNQSQTVHLPKSNLLTPASLLELMEEASTWRPH